MTRFFRRVLFLFVLGSGFVAMTNVWILQKGKRRVQKELAKLPVNDVGLVLGTSPFLGASWKNPFFEGRMDTAAQLYREGKVRHLLVSGDNRQKDYDEPTAMRDALLKRGIPNSAITLDYAGFRTLDSIARAKAVFGLKHCTVITDDFHEPRALFLAEKHGLDAVGFASPPVPLEWSQKTRMREVGSRVKAWLDVYVLRTKPRFYGPREVIQIAGVQ